MVLYLNLKGVYFDAIVTGTKKFEYRLASTWRPKIEGRVFDQLVLRRGYPRRDDSARHLVRPWRGWELQTIVHPHFGEEPVEVCAIVVN